MVDFTKLSRSASASRSLSLIETFSRLDRTVTHVELRPSQHAIFSKLDARLDDRDLVVKLNTGGGKTTIGLIYLKHLMDRYREPVVFLVPTVQLIDQVVEEGRRIGIDVSPWRKAESHPPEKVLRCEAVLACTYEKFFNGKSTFARTDVRLTPAAIVLDDVHSGIESIRKCFGASLSSSCRKQLLDVLSQALRMAEPGNFSRIEQGDPAGLLEVPHWILSNCREELRKIIFSHCNESDLVFSWPYLSKFFEMCRLVFSGESAALILDPPHVEQVEHFVGSRHRLFMSASVHDGAPLIRELGCSKAAVEAPIEVDGELSVGERMIIVPSLADPKMQARTVVAIAANLVSQTNVVVLVPSEAAAKIWVAAGAERIQGDDVGATVAKLRREPRGNFTVFVNRYDGIDLPDSACRVLVIDGLPFGDGLIDRLDNENAGGIVGMRGKLANKVEQGLGRAVRSSSDYCAVILAGQDLANFVSRRTVLDCFSIATVKQMQIGRVVSQAASEESDTEASICDAIQKLLSRDIGWRDYYASEMQSPADFSGRISAEAERRRLVALAERSAVLAAASQDFSKSANLLNQASSVAGEDRLVRGALKQAAAKFLYNVDPVEAMKIQASAFSDNYNLSRPPVTVPPARKKVTPQADNISSWLGNFHEVNGAVIAIDALTSSLSYTASAKVVENAVETLGTYFGADSSRPEREYGRGPDNLWLFGSTAFCIELKNEKSARLWKSDAGQIALSEKWVRQSFPDLELVNVLIGSDVVQADQANDFESHIRVLTSSALQELLGRLRALVVSLGSVGPMFFNEPAYVQKQLGPAKVLPAQLCEVLKKII